MSSETLQILRSWHFIIRVHVPIHIIKNPEQIPGVEPMEFKEEPFIMSFSKPENIDAVISNSYHSLNLSL